MEERKNELWNIDIILKDGLVLKVQNVTDGQVLDLILKTFEFDGVMLGCYGSAMRFKVDGIIYDVYHEGEPYRNIPYPKINEKDLHNDEWWETTNKEIEEALRRK